MSINMECHNLTGNNGYIVIWYGFCGFQGQHWRVSIEAENAYEPGKVAHFTPCSEIEWESMRLAVVAHPMLRHHEFADFELIFDLVNLKEDEGGYYLDKFEIRKKEQEIIY